MNKFEQLIEYVINDDEAKARELFHDIVVEKSRTIYEEMMADEEELEENDDMMGGDDADSLIDDIETEESGISMEDDEMGMDGGMDDDMGGDDFADEEFGGDEEDAGLEDRVVDLEDKLDELMAEFESLMGDEAGEGHGDEEMDMDMDMEVGDGMDDEEVVDDELETEGMFEAVTLKAVPKPTHGDNGQNAKSPVAANSGARGAMAHPVKATGDGGNGRPAPTAKDLIGKVQNTPAQSTVKQSPATKPHLAQASGVNTKSVTN
jgi:hypothetical protein